MKKAKLIKPIEDIYVGGYTFEQIIASKVSAAFTRIHLPKFSVSPLKTLLLKELRRMPLLRLVVYAKCENNNVISKIGIYCDFDTSIDREMERDKLCLDWTTINSCISRYFRSIGYDAMSCQADNEIVNFVERLKEDIPIINEYIVIEDED